MNRNAFLFLASVVLLALAIPASLRGEETSPAPAAGAKVFRIGMIGLDTSHVIAFTRAINGSEERKGFRVVAGFPGGSPDFPPSADRVENFTKQLRDELEVEIVDSIEALCERVDGVLLESVDGRPHLEQVRPVIAAKKPVFIDKPVASSLADVIEIFDLAERAGVPCWSSSSLRYGEGIIDAQKNAVLGDIVGCDAFGTTSWRWFHPDLYLYGIHGVEPLFTVMGTGCETVRRVAPKEEGGIDLTIGVWKDGRVGTFRDLGKGKSDGVVRVYGTKGTATGKSSGYDPLLVEILRFFATGKVPVPHAETIEIYAFMTAADVSKAKDGAAVAIADVIAEAKKEVETKRSGAKEE